MFGKWRRRINQIIDKAEGVADNADDQIDVVGALVTTLVKELLDGFSIEIDAKIRIVPKEGDE